MATTNFPLTRGQPAADPLDELDAAAAAADAVRQRKAQQLVEQLTAQRDALSGKSMLSPEQVMSNKYENDKAYKLGMLALMNPNQGMQQAGGTLFKQALAQRTPQVTEHGIANPLTGEWSYSPEYQRQRLDAQILQAQQHAADTEDKAADKATARQEGRVFKRWAMTQQKPDQAAVVVQMPDGSFQYVSRAAAIQGGLAAPPPASAVPKPPTEDQSKAGGWYNQATSAYGAIKQAIKLDPHASEQPLGEMALGAAGEGGEKAAYARMTPARQLFVTGVSELTEAVLRAASGANVPPHEAKQKIQALTPRYGEDPQVSAWKEQQMVQYLNSLYMRAGPAVANKPGIVPPPGAVPPPVRPGQAAPAAAAADPNDPMEQLRRMYPTQQPPQ